MKTTCGLSDVEIIGMLLRENNEMTLDELEDRVLDERKVFDYLDRLVKGGIVVCFINKDYPKGAYHLTSFGKDIKGVNIK